MLTILAGWPASRDTRVYDHQSSARREDAAEDKSRSTDSPADMGARFAVIALTLLDEDAPFTA